jgi:hypothetical protein
LGIRLLCVGGLGIGGFSRLGVGGLLGNVN